MAAGVGGMGASELITHTPIAEVGSVSAAAVFMGTHVEAGLKSEPVTSAPTAEEWPRAMPITLFFLSAQNG